eukprot:gnl/Hemi2/11017_TR3780_c0_g1_i1.p3 gnl/Hemi2/11017_TR3780_c0_g1~~gnl/Hemi2/11017_TR3780_c0_g1_i1.p3  ORF type:complete len:164 (+),score=39.81 gnl/Hemi2/11017_TR3780_c0_g1_i1:50-541(+)
MASYALLVAVLLCAVAARLASAQDTSCCTDFYSCNSKCPSTIPPNFCKMQCQHQFGNCCYIPPPVDTCCDTELANCISSCEVGAGPDACGYNCRQECRTIWNSCCPDHQKEAAPAHIPDNCCPKISACFGENHCRGGIFGMGCRNQCVQQYQSCCNEQLCSGN